MSIKRKKNRKPFYFCQYCSTHHTITSIGKVKEHIDSIKAMKLSTKLVKQGRSISLRVDR